MNSLTLWFTLGGVFILGIQTSISPCPLATNIAAISYINKQVSSSKLVFFSGLLYTMGRSAAYAALAIPLLLTSIYTGDQLTRFFQTTIHAWLGPILILIGMFLLGILSVSLGKVNADRMQKWAERFGLWSAFPIGVIFALAFCPTSASTFLMMIGLSAKVKSTFLLPVLFGFGTALPVLLFSIILAFQIQWLGKAFNLIGKVDQWSRTITGLLFIVIGIWFVLKYNFEII